MSIEQYERRPEDIEARIEERRASLDRKLEELERRLSPSRQIARVRERLDPRPYTGLAAVGAIAAGTMMAVNGWRKVRSNGHAAPLPEIETLSSDGGAPIEEVLLVCEDDRNG